MNRRYPWIRRPCAPTPDRWSGVVLIRYAKTPRRRIEVVLLGALLLAACGRTDAPAPTGARRIASLYPASTEILFALGVGDRVIARSKWCDYPVAAQSLPALGDAVGPVDEFVSLTQNRRAARNLKVLQRPLDLRPRIRQRLAVLFGNQPRQVVHITTHALGKSKQQLTAPRHRRRAPGRERSTGGSDG